MSIRGHFLVLLYFVVLSRVSCDTPAKDYMYIRHISSTEERELRRLCDEGDLLASVRTISVQLNSDSTYLCHTARFIGHYWIKLEDFHELMSHRDNSVDLSPTHVTLSDEEFIGLRDNTFCRINLIANSSNCRPLRGEEWPQLSTTEVLMKFNNYPLMAANYQSLKTYIIILIVVLMCVTFTAVIHVTQKSVSEWQKKLNHQYIFVVDNK